jgi:hypothetical protein
MNMTELEAFANWLDNCQGDDCMRWAEWQAACAWQRQQDAAICRQYRTALDNRSAQAEGYATAEIEALILNQGKP